MLTSLRTAGVTALDGGASFPRPRYPRDETPSFVLSWVRESLAGLNRRLAERALRGSDAFRVNLSMTNGARSDLWYLQSRPLAPSLAAVVPNLRRSLRLAAGVGLPVVNLLDRRLFRSTYAGARSVFAQSHDLASWFRGRGQQIAGILPVPVHPPAYWPTTASPSRDYILVYFGKETDVAAIEELLSLGYPVKAFGGKSAGWVTARFGATPPSNLEIVGSVSTDRLRELYTNARFTAFPFTDESFGLVPIESMLCGTPVLTYAAQGPGETVLDGRTGWLVPDRRSFRGAAAEHIATEVPTGMATACVERGRRYSLENVAKEWIAAIRSQMDRAPGGPSSPGSRGAVSNC